MLYIVLKIRMHEYTVCLLKQILETVKTIRTHFCIHLSYYKITVTHQRPCFKEFCLFSVEIAFENNYQL